MIIESIRYGISKIFDTRVFLFSALLLIPIVLTFFFSVFFESFLQTFFVLNFLFSLIYILYYPFVFSSLVNYANKELKKKKVESCYKILKESLKFYPRMLILSIIISIILGILFLPSFFYAFFAVYSPESLTIFFIIFILNLIFVIYLYFRLHLSQYLVIIENKGIIDSLKLSWKISKGKVLSLFLIGFIFSILLTFLTLLFLFLFFLVFKNPFISLLVIYLASITSLIYYTFSYSFAYLKFLKKRKRK
ncbi:MAG: hypothetical protein QXL82_01600 [Candidatus Aenigmatarchaeota archaeon]